MICLICRQAEIAEGLTSVQIERGEMKLVVNNVPALVCPNCGEAYMDEGIALRLLHSANKLSAAGVMDLATEYGMSS